MTTAELIKSGQFTLRELTELIKENVKRAKFFGIVLKSQLVKEKVIGKILHENRVILEKHYTGDLLHMKLAYMHLDFYHFLSATQKKYDDHQSFLREEELRKKKEEEYKNLPSYWERRKQAYEK